MSNPDRDWNVYRCIHCGALMTISHAAHCPHGGYLAKKEEDDPHSALMECKRIVDEQADRRISDMRHRLTIEMEINRQLREECEKLRAASAGEAKGESDV